MFERHLKVVTMPKQDWLESSFEPSKDIGMLVILF